MPFGLCNAPATFQRFINQVLHEYLDVFVSAYIDDSIVYTKEDDEELHAQHVRKVLQKFSDNKLYIDINKCEFHVHKVKYLGLIISREGVAMDEDKIRAVKE